MRYLAFQAPDGRFVRDWQYSQGHFDVVLTDNIRLASEGDRRNFETFFGHKGYKLIEITLDVTCDVLK